MKRSSFLASLTASAAALAFSSCATTPGPGSAAPATAASWPPADFKTVRAFVYDCEAERSVGFWHADGTMHKGVLNAPGTVLTKDQTRRLLAAIRTATPKKGRTICYVPHHAFVFCNAASQPVATLEVCFTCNKYIATPAGLPDHFDLGPLWGILHELKVPAEATKGYYRGLYKACRLQ